MHSNGHIQEIVPCAGSMTMHKDTVNSNSAGRSCRAVWVTGERRAGIFTECLVRPYSTPTVSS